MRGERILGNLAIFPTRIHCLRSVIPPKMEVNRASLCGFGCYSNFFNKLDTNIN